jgi:hypothetical protein
MAAAPMLHYSVLRHSLPRQNMQELQMTNHVGVQREF